MPKTKNSHSKARSVPFVHGFRRPTEARIQRAVTTQGKPKEDLPKEFSGENPHFEPIPKCVSVDDWLAQYKEGGQTYRQFLEQCPWLSTRKPKYLKMEFNPEGVNIRSKYPQGTIYLLPLQRRSKSALSEPGPDIASIIEYTETFLGLPVQELPTVTLESDHGRVHWIEDHEDKDLGKKGRQIGHSHISCRYNHQTGNYQLCISDMLQKLRTRLPDNAICLVALTTFDLYQDPPDLFVAGMAAGNHRVAVFSLLRYDPNLDFSAEFWYDITRVNKFSDDKRHSLILQRSCKLVVHEIGHLLGLDHCIFYSCCMNGAGHLEEDFRQPMHLCPVDLRKLQSLCGFDVIWRYEKLQKFYCKMHMHTEDAWVQNRLKYLMQ